MADVRLYVPKVRDTMFVYETVQMGFHPVVSLVSCLLHWSSSIDLRELLNDMGPPKAHVKIFLNEQTALEFRNPALAIVTSLRKVKHGYCLCRR